MCDIEKPGEEHFLSGKVGVIVTGVAVAVAVLVGWRTFEKTTEIPENAVYDPQPPTGPMFSLESVLFLLGSMGVIVAGSALLRRYWGDSDE